MISGFGTSQERVWVPQLSPPRKRQLKDLLMVSIAVVTG